MVLGRQNLTCDLLNVVKDTCGKTPVVKPRASPLQEPSHKRQALLQGLSLALGEWGEPLCAGGAGGQHQQVLAHGARVGCA